MIDSKLINHTIVLRWLGPFGLTLLLIFERSDGLRHIQAATLHVMHSLSFL